MFCDKCGTRVVEEMAFCSKCGNLLQRMRISYGSRSVNSIEESQPSGTMNLRHKETLTQQKKSSLKILLGVFIGIFGVLIVLMAIVLLSGESYSEPNIVESYSEPSIVEPYSEPNIDEPYPESNVDEVTDDNQEVELIPLTAREVYEANVDAVFTIFMRVPHYWTEEEISRYIRYPLFLPTGSYIPIGSGFFVNHEGVAVTNHHVVVDLEHMVARTHDGNVHPILGYYSYDVGNDIAIIQVEGSGFSYTTFTEIPIKVADYVYAIGSSAGDPNTFTSGVVSRFADEIHFGIYTVTDMIQFTAPIYGGNSGGPLFNQFGQVIGIVSAGSVERASVGFAVRIDRVDLTIIETRFISSFPIGTAGVIHAVRYYYESFPIVPTLESSSDYPQFLIGGEAVDLGIDIFGYERVYLYYLSVSNVFDAVVLFEEALLSRGFVFQDFVEFGETETWIYFYNEQQNISVSMWYMWNTEEMIIAIGRGNIFEEVYGSDVN